LFPPLFVPFSSWEGRGLNLLGCVRRVFPMADRLSVPPPMDSFLSGKECAESDPSNTNPPPPPPPPPPATPGFCFPFLRGKSSGHGGYPRKHTKLIFWSMAFPILLSPPVDTFYFHPARTLFDKKINFVLFLKIRFARRREYPTSPSFFL